MIFDHTQKDFWDAIGIDKEHYTKIVEAMEKIYEYIELTRDNPVKSKMIEALVQEANVVSHDEYFVAGLITGSVFLKEHAEEKLFEGVLDFLIKKLKEAGIPIEVEKITREIKEIQPKENPSPEKIIN